MVWGAIASSGVRRLIFIEGTTDCYVYKNMENN